jgi:hypothetical protein
MFPIPLTESIQQITVPALGPMIRIERRDPEGDVVDDEYRRPSPRAG